MRRLALLGLFLLTACSAPTAIPIENRAPTSVSTQSTIQPTISAAPESSEPLYVWNEAQSRYEIHLVDLATGQDVPGHTPFVVGENSQYTGSNTLAANGQMIAVVTGKGSYCYSSGEGSACMGRAHFLHIIRREDWSDVTAMLPGQGWVGLISFSPDVKQVALIFSDQKSNTVMLFDTSTGNLIAHQDLAFTPTLMEYASDGKTLVLYGQPLGADPGIAKPDPPRVVLLDALNLGVKWEQELPSIISGYWCLEKCSESHDEQTFAEWTPAVVLSPDRDQLYIVHADDEQLTTVDFKSHAIDTIEIQKVRSFFERVLSLTAGVAHAKGGNFNGAFKAGVISPDGTRLYVVDHSMSTTLANNGEHQEMDESLGLQVIDVASGRKLSIREYEATWIKITPDGSHLILGNWGDSQIEVLDASTLKRVALLPQLEIVTTSSVNGEPVILASQSGQALTKMAVLDARNFNLIHSWSLNTSYASWVPTP